MLDQLKDDKWPISFKGLMMWATGIWLVVMFFVPASFVYQNMTKEIEWGQKMIGTTEFPDVMRTTNARYKYFFIDTGIDSALKNYYKPIKAKTNTGDALNKIGDMAVPFFTNGAKVFNYLLYIMTYRLSLIMYWIPFLIVVGVPSIFAGTMKWMSKRYTFAYSSPFFNRRSLTMIGWGIFSMLLSLFIPFPIPPMIGAVVLIVAMPIAFILLISNLPKRI
ncbi:DUF4400 domain-containing protein (plasmid) [Providencia huaxiensis]|uniref:DUF4400 domain-containing protein n=8 Tax=Enterobacterales TaxID=91347 RepID=A0A7L8KBL3_ECOLX|nr:MULTISPECIES: DUF4400 domain-containing protein [Enterobacterales]ELB1214859.1 DUF4400 domain-containing protein [Proteus mirabilis]ELY4881501.1 DUF4400 domain-containing protein [Morganella morganii]QOE89702.1 hypothetical protein [Escherichia coli]SPY66569.1 integrating conjugative element membrane protein, PFL_4697 family [Providencia stuartii]SUC33725.1 integrating conjugative element membrane protein, PFL_4697 family [Providencia rustigianii]BAB93766.1 hypothetical protein [Proteus vu